MARKIQKQEAEVRIAETPMVGPDHSGSGISFCIVCHRSFLNGDHWRKVRRLGRGGITVGVHDACRVNGRAPGAPGAP